MSQSRHDAERKVARASIALVVSLAAVVGIAQYSSHHSPHDAGDQAISSAVTHADPDHSGQGFTETRMVPVSTPALVTTASGDPLLRTGFGHLHLAPAMTYANLTVYPVLSDHVSASSAHAAHSEFETLGEAMSNHEIQVTEPDGGGSTPPGLTVPSAMATNADEGSEHRGANLLFATVVGPSPTYVPDGQVVPGGGQDRGVASDTVLPARSAQVAIPAFCVEEGRSEGGTEFSQGVAIAVPSVRYAMQVVGDQQPVWNSVAVATSYFGAHSDSGTYRGLMNSNAANLATASYTDALTLPVPAASRGHVVGAVVTINGKLVCADVYRNPALFAQLWPALLHSYSLQAAMMNGKGKGVSADRQAAGKWLAEMDAAPGAQTRHSQLTQVARVATEAGGGLRSAAITSGHDAKKTLLHEAFFTKEAALPASAS